MYRSSSCPGDIKKRVWHFGWLPLPAGLATIHFKIVFSRGFNQSINKLISHMSIRNRQRFVYQAKRIFNAQQCCIQYWRYWGRRSKWSRWYLSCSYVKLNTIGNNSLPRVSHTLEVLSTGNKRSEVDSSCCLITALNKIIYLGSPGNVVTLL